MVQIAADETAVWLPNRDWAGRRPANTYIARRDYVALGVPWESGGGDEATRKDRQRALEDLARTGRVKVFRPRRIKTLTVKLSDAAREQARALAGQPGELSAWLSMRELARHSKRPARMMTDVWIPETVLIGTVPAGRTLGREAALVEDLLTVALICGWVVSNSDIQGRIYYCLTDAGWARLDGPEPADDATVKTDPEAAEWFIERLEVSMARLDTALTEAREIGDLPLPVSMVDLPVQ